MLRKVIYIILLIFLLTDVGFSFLQHYTMRLDGDMAGGIVPAADVKPVLKDPFGVAVLLKKKSYPNPNRFFSHQLLYSYFNKAPLFLQRFVEPIDSVYLSCALVKISIQIGLILLLGIFISGTKNLLRMDLIMAIALITPLFQTNYYRMDIGIIDKSTTYTFFYALPFLFLLLYFCPLVFQLYHNKSIFSNWSIKILWIPLAVVVCLSGPLNPGVALLFSLLVIFAVTRKTYVQSNKKGFVKKCVDAITCIPKMYWYYLLPIDLFAIYSLYIGQHDSIYIENSIPFSDLYIKLLNGIVHQLVQNLGLQILLLVIATNIILIQYQYKTEEVQRILRSFQWLGLFSLMYILLLPLGGYRYWRPTIVRYDTLIPVTIGLMFTFGSSTLFLLKRMADGQKTLYTSVVVLILLLFTVADKPHFDTNLCERSALKQISESQDTVVKLQDSCAVLSWKKIIKPEDSELNAQLLQIWRITRVKRLYYNSASLESNIPDRKVSKYFSYKCAGLFQSICYYSSKCRSNLPWSQCHVNCNRSPVL